SSFSISRSSLRPWKSSYSTSARRLSKTPNPPRRFHNAQPQPASFQRSRQSFIHASATLWGVRLNAPHSPICTPTPFASSSFHGSIFSLRRVSLFHSLSPFFSGQVGSDQ